MNQPKRMREKQKVIRNHSTQDSRVVPHRGTNWAAPWLTSQIGRDAVLSRSYGRGWILKCTSIYKLILLNYLDKYNLSIHHPQSAESLS